MKNPEPSPRSHDGTIVDLGNTTADPFEAVFVLEFPWVRDGRQHTSDGIPRIPLNSLAQEAHDLEVQLRYCVFDSDGAINQGTTSSNIQSITNLNESLRESLQ